MVLGAKRLGYGGETTRVENMDETIWGKRLGVGKTSWGETSRYPGKGLTSWLLFVMFNCVLSLSYVVSCVR